MPVRPIVASAAVVAAAVLLPAAAGAAMPLANYRSVIDLRLAEGSDAGEGAGITGRAVTEFVGSACAGYTTTVRFVTQTTAPTGARQVDDVRGVSFETAGGVLEFENEVYTDNKLVEHSAGRAATGNDGVTTVTLTEPGEKTFVLPGDIAFPTDQVVRTIAAGIAGKRFLSFGLYDGTDEGETVYGTSTVIGPASTEAGDVGVETGVADAGFAAMRHWPVTISYFRDPDSTDMTPAYTMSLVLYENGVTRDLKLDYGVFALHGKLTTLEMLPAPDCPG